MGRSLGIAYLRENSDENDRDYGQERIHLALLGRRRMIHPKRRGPLFG